MKNKHGGLIFVLLPTIYQLLWTENPSNDYANFTRMVRRNHGTIRIFGTSMKITAKNVVGNVLLNSRLLTITEG